MTRWHLIGVDRMPGVTIAYARVAWLAVMVMHVRAVDMPPRAVEEWRQAAISEKARPPVRCWWQGWLSASPYTAVGVCLWRDARWTSGAMAR